MLESAGLPKTEKTVGRIAYYMETALRAGYNVKPSDVVDQVRQDYKFELNSFLGNIPEDALEEFLGADNYRRIAKSTVKASRMQPTPVAKSVNEDRKPQEKKKVRSPRDFFGPGF